MKPSLSKTSLAVAVAALSIGTANASLVTYTDTYTPESSVYLSSDNTTYSFTHNTLPQDFNSATDTITAASLEFFFRDNSKGDSAEKVDIYLDGQKVARVEANSSFIYNLTSPFTSISEGSLLNTLIDVQIGGGNSPIGDFYFEKSVLTVAVERVASLASPQAANNVPEPATLGLIGLVLAGLGFGRKGRKARSE